MKVVVNLEHLQNSIAKQHDFQILNEKMKDQGTVGRQLSVQEMLDLRLGDLLNLIGNRQILVNEDPEGKRTVVERRFATVAEAIDWQKKTDMQELKKEMTDKYGHGTSACLEQIEDIYALTITIPEKDDDESVSRENRPST